MRKMLTGKAVFRDLSAFRAELRAYDTPYQDLLRLSIWRPLRDIAVDWVLVALAVVVVVKLGFWLAPLAIVLIANRQRALGNILHDAGHRNLHRSREVNDSVADVLVAPLVFADLEAYRDAHFLHHLDLGTRDDPDLLHRPKTRELPWGEHYARQVLSLRQWWGSLIGHLGSRQVSIPRKCYILGWWAVGCSLLWQLAGTTYLIAFVVLWLLARGTVFHVITMFREMCDHYGLEQGGVLSFTRDVLKRSVWYVLFHPRNNGYHLTHHLLPAIPYYNLPAAQIIFCSMPSYRATGRVCDSYVFGRVPVVQSWAKGI
jgi:fatty acid desaturase